MAAIPPGFDDRAAHPDSSGALRSNTALWQNTLIESLIPQHHYADINAVDPTTVLFLDLSEIPRGTPLPDFPNLSAVHIRPDSAFVPAPVVVHTINVRDGSSWDINPGLVPKMYSMAAYQRINRVVLNIRAASGADLAASDLDIHEWIDVLSSLGKTVAKDTIPGDKNKRTLQLVLRIVVASPDPMPPPPNWDVGYSALVKLGTAVGSVLPDIELVLDGPEEWDMGWLGFNFFAQQPSYTAAYEQIATQVACTQTQGWDMMFISMGHDKWVKRALQKRLIPLKAGQYEKRARRECTWEFEGSCW